MAADNDVLPIVEDYESLLPTVEDYKRGLLKLEKKMNPKQREMLVQHYGALGHRLTANQLAKKVGYKNYSGVNAQYGILGRKLADAMHWTPPPPAQASFSIAAFYRPDARHPEWRWEMHDNLAKALEELKWVSGPRRQTEITVPSMAPTEQPT